MTPLHTVLTAPVWVAQALRLAATAPRLPEAAGPRAGRVGAGRLRLLVLGDSSAAGVGVARQDQALAGQLVAELADLEPDWTLRARSGATTARVLRHLATKPPPAVDVAVVALGVNDVTRGRPLAGWLGAQRALLDLLVGQAGARFVYLSGIPPMGMFPALPRPLRDVLGAQAARFDAALAGLAGAHPGVRHLAFDGALLDPVMMASDGYHPGPQIYAWWAGQLAARIRADLGAAAVPAGPATPPPATGAPRP